MMVATYKCGCPPPPRGGKPSCSPCCASPKRVAIAPPDPQSCPQSGCCRQQLPKPVISLPKIEPPACCPTMPACEDLEKSQKLRSEIAEKGLPYTELEAMINNNRLIIRTQKEEVKPKYDPPCDCIEDSSPKSEENDDINVGQACGTRTITLYPRAKHSDPEVAETSRGTADVRFNGVSAIEQEENPNIFLLRVKKTSTEGDKRFNIDLEFRTPRPWSSKKRQEHEKMAKPDKPVEVSTMKKDVKRPQKVQRSSKKKKKK